MKNQTTGSQTVNINSLTARLLESLVALHPNGEKREGQYRMALAVEEAFADGHHLLVQAGTGTGKSLAYLSAVVGSDKKVVIATATKALQDQLAKKDIPFVQAHMNEVMAGGDSKKKSIKVAVVKGRSNYLCKARIAAFNQDFSTVAGNRENSHADARDGHQDQLFFYDDLKDHADAIRDIISWSRTSQTGDIDSYPTKVDMSAWRELSVGSQECPGRKSCDYGYRCFAEMAWDNARISDIVIANMHLLVLDIHSTSDGTSNRDTSNRDTSNRDTSGEDDDAYEAYSDDRGGNGVFSRLLEDCDGIVIDEAHMLAQIAGDVLGVSLSFARLEALARSLRKVFTSRSDSGEGGVDDQGSGDGRNADHIGNVMSLANSLVKVLDSYRGDRINLDDVEVDNWFSAAETVLAGISANLSSLRNTVPQRLQCFVESASSFVDVIRGHIAQFRNLDSNWVAWVEEEKNISGASPMLVLRLTPLLVGELLSKELFAKAPVVATSATLSLGGDFQNTADLFGLMRDEWVGLDVGTPFDLANQALLYCASDLPDPRHAEFGDLARGELLDLIKAAGGRTLALFTSRASMQEAIDVLSPKLAEKGINLLGQDDMSKDALIRVFSEDETSCLFATMSFWQGVDVPGPACSLVVIDKLPFKPPDNPVSQARRELALSQGLNPFITIDLPHCAILLAQGMGRLLRSKQDRGVVAVLDRRLVESSYSKPLLSSLPPLPLTCDKAGVIAFLNDVCAGYSPVNNRK